MPPLALATSTVGYVDFWNLLSGNFVARGLRVLGVGHYARQSTLAHTNELFPLLSHYFLCQLSLVGRQAPEWGECPSRHRVCAEFALKSKSNAVAAEESSVRPNLLSKLHRPRSKSKAPCSKCRRSFDALLESETVPFHSLVARNCHQRGLFGRNSECTPAGQ